MTLEELSNKLYKSKILHDYKDGKIDYRKVHKFIVGLDEALTIPVVMHCPDELEPVLAKIEHINDLGKSKWYEVVYFDGNWRSYSGSKTFEDGEKVVKWKYCKGCV